MHLAEPDLGKRRLRPGHKNGRHLQGDEAKRTKSFRMGQKINTDQKYEYMKHILQYTPTEYSHKYPELGNTHQYNSYNNY